MADPYVPGLTVARSVYDQGIAPFAKKVQGFLKGTAGLPGTVKDYAVETIQSEGGPTTKVMADLLTLGQGMSQGFQDNPLRFMAEMNPLVGGASDLFETNQLLNLAENAEEAGDLEKAQTLRELANTIVLMGIVPGGPPAKKTIEQKLKEITEKRQKLTEETGLPYVPSNKPDLGEGKPIYGDESPHDTALRNKLASANIKFSMDRDAPGMDLESFNMINDPEHFIKSRGKITNIEQMSPTEYIERVSKDVFPTFGEAEIRRQRERTGKIPLMMEAMQEGTEFGLPTIHYDDGTRKFPSQEGLHRAMAAERLGVPEIPVAIHQLDRSPAARAARADEFGFTTDVYHGTRADFSEFDPNMVDIGIHVGSPSQATNRLLDESSSAVNFSGNIAKGVTRARNRFDEGSQILPLKAKINNVLEMPDVGEWKNSFNVIDGLIKHPKFKDKVPELQEMRKVAEEEGVSYRDEYGDSTWDTSPENRELLNELNTLIRKEGFDTIKYLNEHENNLIRKTKDDPHSYIILDPKNVRSTSADFNPLRMNEADLQAGIASLGAREGTA